MPGLDDVVKIPGLTNAWTMPIKTRIDMLSTGIKTPIGIKVAGSDLNTLAELAEKIASQLRTLPDTVSVFSEKTVGGYYVDFKINRAEAARYGMNVARRAGRDPHGPGRNERHHDRRRAGALSGQRPLSAGTARRPDEAASERLIATPERSPNSHRASHRTDRSTPARRSSAASRPSPTPGFTWTSPPATSAATSAGRRSWCSRTSSTSPTIPPATA